MFYCDYIYLSIYPYISICLSVCLSNKKTIFIYYTDEFPTIDWGTEQLQTEIWHVIGCLQARVYSLVQSQRSTLTLATLLRAEDPACSWWVWLSIKTTYMQAQNTSLQLDSPPKKVSYIYKVLGNCVLNRNAVSIVRSAGLVLLALLACCCYYMVWGW